MMKYSQKLKVTAFVIIGLRRNNTERDENEDGKF